MHCSQFSGQFITNEGNTMNFYIQQVLNRGSFSEKKNELQVLLPTGIGVVKSSTKLNDEEYARFLSKFGQETCDKVGLRSWGAGA
jgi:hypothetical protein